MKSYTDIEQSKKLAEILPLESADMYFTGLKDIYNPKEYEYEVFPKVMGKWIVFDDRKAFHPCWSLAALLDIIPKRIKDFNVLRIDIGEKDFAIWYDEIGYGVNTEFPDIIKASAVDACYDMIIKLREQNIL